jgi:hypothetical protein
MPIDLWFENKGGGRQVRILDTKTVDEEGRFSISIPDFKPSKVYFDPYQRSLRVGQAPEFHSFGELAPEFLVVRDSAHPEYLSEYAQAETGAKSGDFENKFFIGHPSTMPQMKELCVKAGFAVNGDLLTFQGTTINLNNAAAVAIIDLGNGKHCAIGLGKCLMEPNLGNAYVGVVDELGRMLRAKTRFPASPSSGLPM